MILYIHKNNTDIACEVVKKFYVKEKDLYKFKLSWYRVSRARGKLLWPLGVTERHSIPRKTWQEDWELFNYG